LSASQPGNQQTNTITLLEPKSVTANGKLKEVGQPKIEYLYTLYYLHYYAKTY